MTLGAEGHQSGNDHFGQQPTLLVPSVPFSRTGGIRTISAFLFLGFVDRFGMHTGFSTFAVIRLVGTLVFWRFVPETKGRSLEEIERSWEHPGGAAAGPTGSAAAAGPSRHL